MDGNDEITKKLLETPLFVNFEQEDIKNLVEKAEIRTYEPDEPIWKLPKNQNYMGIILEGCVVVIDYNEEGNTTIDALLCPGQLLGEFEFLGFDAKSQSLQTITNTTTLVLRNEDLKSLAQEKPLLFYENLAKTLVRKLRIGNHWLKVRDKMDVKDRLIILLDQFKLHDECLPLIEYPTSNDRKKFEINVYWSSEQLEWCLSSEMCRTIAPKIAELIEESLIEVKGFTEFNEPGKILGTEFFKSLTDENSDYYFKITVLNHRKMRRIVG